MQEIRKSDVIAPLIMSGPLFYAANRMGDLYEKAEGDILTKLSHSLDAISVAISERPFFVSSERIPLMFGVGAVLALFLGWLYHMATRKNYMFGQEHGTAQWASIASVQKFKDKGNPDNNLIFSQDFWLRMKMPKAKNKRERRKNFLLDRNKNVCVIGGSGSGKSFSIIKPNLMQLNGSYVLTDPKGTIQPETMRMFLDEGFEVKVLNTIDLSKSMHYNPLSYIRNIDDIPKIIDNFIQNTDGDAKATKGDPFWEKTERMLLAAIIGLLYEMNEPESLNFPMVSKILAMCEIHEEDESYESAFDLLFKDHEQSSPNSFAVSQYKKFKQAAGKTAKSIVITCAARLSMFDSPEMQALTSYDELELDKIGDRKTVLYAIMSDTDKSRSWLLAMMFYQTFNLLCTHADNDCRGKLPIPVQFLIDEFANIGKIKDFEILISTIRSRNISSIIILQSIAQLESMYEKAAEIIIDNCDTLVFLGGKSVKTTEQISKMTGKATIDAQNTSVSKGGQGSYSMQDQILGRDLIDPSEVNLLERDQCIVLMTNCRPFKGRKFVTEEHKRFMKIADGDTDRYMTIDELGEYRSKQWMAHARIVEGIDLSELNDL